MPKVELLPVTYDPDRLLMWADENFRRITDAIGALASPGSSGLSVPAGNVVAGTFGANVGGGIFTFNTQLVIDNGATVDPLVIQGSGGNIKVVSRNASDFNALYRSSVAFRIWNNIAGVDRFFFYDDGEFGCHHIGVNGDNTDNTGIWVYGGNVSIKGNYSLYFQDWGGGWFMSDTAWIRATNDKSVYTGGQLGAGLARMGNSNYSPASDFAEFSHASRFNGTNNYSLLSQWDGTTYLNSTTFIYFRSANVTKASMSGSEFFVGDGSTMRFQAYRFDQIGDWTVCSILSHSGGGSSSTRISFWSEGQSAAPIFKDWIGDFECRTSTDAGYTNLRAASFTSSRSTFKQGIVDATSKLSKVDRKTKIKNLRTVHYQRQDHPGCANCRSTGKKKEHQGISQEERDNASDDEPCPDCNGDPRTRIPAHWKKGEESGWFGFVAEEVAEIFPEAIGWKQYAPDEEPVAEAVELLGMIAILWEEVKDIRAELEKK